MYTRLGLQFTVIVFVLAGCSPAAPSAIGITTRVSVSSSGVKGNAKSAYPNISSDGRFVAFQSDATNLVPGDTNGATDIFVHDRRTAKTELISVSSSGSLGNDRSESPYISAGGRYVAFMSFANNLVADDTNDAYDIFVHDRQTGATELISVNSTGVQGNLESGSPSISADGRYVAFESAATNLAEEEANGHLQIFVHDRQTGTTELVSINSSGEQGENHSTQSTISSNGRYVVFESEADNLVTVETNGYWNVFVHDRQTGATELVSVSSTGMLGNSESWNSSISSTGRYVVFESHSSDLVNGDTNGFLDSFVHDRETGVTELVAVSSTGMQGVSASWNPSISSDGRYVAFESDSGNLAAEDKKGDPDVFIHDRKTGNTVLVSINSDMEGNPFNLSLSSDGRHVAFSRDPAIQAGLVYDDTSDFYDVFVYDRGEAVPIMPSTPTLVVIGLIVTGLVVLGIIGLVIILVRRSKNSLNKPFLK